MGKLDVNAEPKKRYQNAQRRKRNCPARFEGIQQFIDQNDDHDTLSVFMSLTQKKSS